mgnify:FL=1
MTSPFLFLKEEIEKEAQPMFCYKCGKSVKPIVRLLPTLIGTVEVEYLCPVHKIVLAKEIREMKLPKREVKITKGLYISADGIDGAGKTTFAKELVKLLKMNGFEALYVKEPHIPAIKEFLYKYDIDADAEVYIFATDRMILQKTIVIPALESGKLVVSDRSIYTSIVYQSIRGVDEEFIIGVNRGVKYPDIVFILDIDAELAYNRLKKTRASLTKYESLDFLKEARKLFLEIPKKYSKLSKFYILDADKDVKTLAKEALTKIKENI